MGGDSCGRGCGFESEHQQLVGHFSQQIGEKRQCLLEKDQKMNEKDAGNALRKIQEGKESFKRNSNRM